jgi:hypothetical protein
MENLGLQLQQMHTQIDGDLDNEISDHQSDKSSLLLCLSEGRKHSLEKDEGRDHNAQVLNQETCRKEGERQHAPGLYELDQDPKGPGVGSVSISLTLLLDHRCLARCFQIRREMPHDLQD